MKCDACILQADGISFSYREDRTILDDVSLCIAPGEMLTLLGPNGAGKSTLLNCLVGALSPQSGQVLLEDRPVTDMLPRDVAQRIAYVPQTSNPTYGYQTRDYVAMGRAPHKGMFQKPDEDDYALVDEAMERLGITRLAKQPYTQLSG